MWEYTIEDRLKQDIIRGQVVAPTMDAALKKIRENRPDDTRFDVIKLMKAF